METLPDVRIRSAFIKPHSYTNLVFNHNKRAIVVTSAVKETDYGVETGEHQQSPCSIGSRITCLERTLINAVVSPHYNGGLSSICAYFQLAADKLDIVKMIEIYRKLKFPWMQTFQLETGSQIVNNWLTLAFISNPSVSLFGTYTRMW